MWIVVVVIVDELTTVVVSLAVDQIPVLVVSA
jgi:hypothetical protein